MAAMVVLVRTVKARTGLGIFWGESLTEIARQVDAVHSPVGCEYARLRPGGVLFRGQTGAIPPDATGRMTRLFEGAMLDEANDLATGEGRQTWRRFTRSHLTGED